MSNSPTAPHAFFPKNNSQRLTRLDDLVGGGGSHAGDLAKCGAEQCAIGQKGVSHQPKGAVRGEVLSGGGHKGPHHGVVALFAGVEGGIADDDVVLLRPRQAVEYVAPGHPHRRTIGKGAAHAGHGVGIDVDQVDEGGTGIEGPAPQNPRPCPQIKHTLTGQCRQMLAQPSATGIDAVVGKDPCLADIAPPVAVDVGPAVAGDAGLVKPRWLTGEGGGFDGSHEALVVLGLLVATPKKCLDIAGSDFATGVVGATGYQHAPRRQQCPGLTEALAPGFAGGRHFDQDGLVVTGRQRGGICLERDGRRGVGDTRGHPGMAGHHGDLAGREGQRRQTKGHIEATDGVGVFGAFVGQP